MSKGLESLIKKGFGMSVIKPSQFDYDQWNGRLLIYEPPEVGEIYAIGVDPAEGVSADRSVIEVIKVGNLNHPDVQVAEFACDFLDPVDFAGVVNTVGRFYADSEGTEALATIEVNAPCGDAMISDLRMRLDYTNLFIWKAYDRVNNMWTNKLGWWTNRTTRPKLIARGIHAFANDDLIINSPYLLDEMADFERDHFIAKAKARAGMHDDRIMAILIGFQGAHDEEWLSGEDVNEERRLRNQGKELQDELIEAQDAPVRAADYQNQALTAAKMWEQANDSFMED